MLEDDARKAMAAAAAAAVACRVSMQNKCFDLADSVQSIYNRFAPGRPLHVLNFALHAVGISIRHSLLNKLNMCLYHVKSKPRSIRFHLHELRLQLFKSSRLGITALGYPITPNLFSSTIVVMLGSGTVPRGFGVECCVYQCETSLVTNRKNCRRPPLGKGNDSCGVTSVSQTISPASRSSPSPRCSRRCSTEPRSPMALGSTLQGQTLVELGTEEARRCHHSNHPIGPDPRGQVNPATVDPREARDDAARPPLAPQSPEL